MLRRSSQPDAVFPYEDAVWFCSLLGVRTTDNADVQTDLRRMWAKENTLMRF